MIMFNIKANIFFTHKRKSGPLAATSIGPYRPILLFSEQVKRSGLIVIGEEELLFDHVMYEDRLIQIYFYKDLNTSKEFFAGREFLMGEGSFVVGHGVITEVLGEES